MAHELLLMLQDLRISAPDFYTDAALVLSSPVIYLAIPIALGSILFWCIDKHSGEWILMNIFCAVFVDNILKDVIRNPRPWVTDDRILPENRALDGAKGFSTPSGHSCEGTSGFGSLAFVSKHHVLRIIFIVLIVGIMFSRLYLGVHTLLDILMGFLTAAIIMGINLKLMRLSYADDGAYNRIGILYILVFIVLAAVWGMVRGNPSWYPVYCSMIIGVLIGRLVEHNLIRFETDGLTKGTIIFRMVIGSLVTMTFFCIPYLMLGGTEGTAIGGFAASFAIFVVSPSLFNLNSNN